MEKELLQEMLYRETLEQEAWSSISEDSSIKWTEELIDKYIDKLDWNKLSENKDIFSDQYIIAKYQERIDWSVFSKSYFAEKNRGIGMNNSPKKYADISIIEQFLTFWDWTELCENIYIQWTFAMLDKFDRFIDWKALSKSIFTHQDLDRFMLIRYEINWNWRELSLNSHNITPEIIEEFADNWDWNMLIYNPNIDWSSELYEKYKSYIHNYNKPFEGSVLWKKLVLIDSQKIKEQIKKEIEHI